ncbi:MAG: LytR/AlgR family response regulator transcription factor [Candidatus Cyclobacteriaceae bacterium M3_2C_046]
MKIKAIVIDDENLATEIIISFLKEYEQIEVCAVCYNGFEGLKAIQQHQPALIFLDVQMPKITGFEMLELLENPPQVIFTTAYDQYALKAFELNAIDYLLKPFSRERFHQAVDKALHAIQQQASQENIHHLKDHLDQEKESIDRVVVKTGSKIKIIPVQQIKYLEAQDDYVMIYTEEGKFLKQKTMKKFESQLNGLDFIRIHRSYIVNVNLIHQVELFEKSSYRLTLKTGHKLPVSKSGYSKLKEVLNI